MSEDIFLSPKANLVPKMARFQTISIILAVFLREWCVEASRGHAEKACFCPISLPNPGSRPFLLPLASITTDSGVTASLCRIVRSPCSALWPGVENRPWCGVMPVTTGGAGPLAGQRVLEGVASLPMLGLGTDGRQILTAMGNAAVKLRFVGVLRIVLL